MAETNGGPIRIASEKWNEAVEVTPGFWIIATHHRPGFSKHQPEINNRCLVFRLRDQSAGNAEVLVVVNAVDAAALAEVRRLESTLGIPVKYLMSPGGGHVVMLPEWHDALPGAQIFVGPTRIPRTEQGKRLAASPRFKVFDSKDPLPQFRGQLEVVNFDGLLGFRENKTPKEGGKDSMLGMIKIMFTEMPPKDPTDELWLYHVASQTVVGGENLGWILSKQQYSSFPFVLRMMMKPEQLYIMNGPRKVADPARVAANWKTILSWSARTVMTYHDSLGTAFIASQANQELEKAVKAVKQL
jgi:hypothetical protein